MPKKSASTRYSLVPLFDKLLGQFHLKNDAALARALEVAPPEISKGRHGKPIPIDRLILRIHEKFDIPVAEIRSHMVVVPA